MKRLFGMLVLMLMILISCGVDQYRQGEYVIIEKAMVRGSGWGAPDYPNIWLRTDNGTIRLHIGKSEKANALYGLPIGTRVQVTFRYNEWKAPSVKITSFVMIGEDKDEE